MFEKSRILYFYVESALHAGSGANVGIVDLPIQRERTTHYPLVQASSVKGKLRAEVEERKKSDPNVSAAIDTIFGPASSTHAGALSPGDARLLLFPVRSLVGVFAWTTSLAVLARFLRDMKSANQTISWTLPNPPAAPGVALVSDLQSVAAGNNKVVLEEFSITAQQDADVTLIADWLSQNALPQARVPVAGQAAADDEYAWYRRQLMRKLVILPEDVFRDFTQFSTEIITRIKIKQETKTVEGGALWTEEHLPADTLLYTPLYASRPRNGSKLFNDAGGKPSAAEVLRYVAEAGIDRMQIGGDETVGRGLVTLRFGG